MYPFFVTLESIDFGGKSTVAEGLGDPETLAWELAPSPERDRMMGAVITREPGGCPAAEKIRAILKTEAVPNESTRLLLNVAARAFHVEEVIRPALKEGKIVICDRFIDSTIAYQGIVGGLGIDTVLGAHGLACGARGVGGLMPDLTIWIDLDPAIAYDRMRQSETTAVFGVEPDDSRLDRLGELAKAYALLNELFPFRFHRVDGNQPPIELLSEVAQVIAEKMKSARRLEYPGV